MYAKISKKGQITIPKTVRDILNTGKNGAVLFVVENHEVKLKGVPVSEAELLAGSLSEYAPNYIPLNKAREMVWEEVVKETAKEGLTG
jgi:AbrB family looped-hinge helix DNA binding protein